jgi:C-terminal processing protease CtpA/Prc
MRSALRSQMTNGIAAIVRASMVCAMLACTGSTQTGSIGAVLGRDEANGAVHVREAPQGLAAADAGLLPGDRIKMIDGILVDDLDAKRIHDLLRGPVGTKVTLTVIRGEEVLQLELTRRALGADAAVKPPEERIEE